MDIASASVEIAKAKRGWRLPERLPDLKGKWLTAYTILWAMMLPLAMTGAALSAWINLTTPAMWTPYGFATSEDSTGIHVDAVTAPTVRSTGLRSGDYIVRVDDWSVPTTAARRAARNHVVKPDGATTVFTVRRATGDLYKVRLVRSRLVEEQGYREAGVSRAFARAMDGLGTLAVPCLLLGASILLFVRRRRETVPALLSLSFLMMAAVFGGGDPLGIVPVGAVGIFTSIAFCLMMAALFAFPSGRFEPPWTALPVLLLVLLPLVPPDWGNLLAAGNCLLAVVALISRYRRLPAGAERLQLRWAFLGFLIGALMIVVSLGFDALGAASIVEDPRWVVWRYTFGPLILSAGLAAIAIGLIVSILRYRLYDADAVIGRSAAYGILTLGFIGLFAGSEKLAELIGERYFEHSIGIAAGAIGAAVAAVCIVPLHNRVHRWAERRFQKPLIRLREGLPECVGDLRESASVEQLVSAVLSRVEAGTRSSRGAVLLYDKGKLGAAGTRGVPVKTVREWKAALDPTAG
jgi:hypothetical protein